MAKRNQRTDKDLIATLALPAAAANAQTASLDLQGAVGNCELELACEATTTLVATKTITLTVQESDSGSSFAAAPWAPTITITGKTGDGSVAVAQRIGIPSTAKRYMRAYAAVDTGGGDNTANKFLLKACF